MRSQCNASALSLLILAIAACGCSETTELSPVTGKVLFNGEPLNTGVVMFQPAKGPPARGQIQPDGSFELELLGVGRGAVLGTNKVRVSAREPSPPGDVEAGLGRLLIPRRYTDFDSSGLVVEVEPERTEPYLIKLTK